MKALITGATGFVGRHLVAELVRRGWQCRCLTRNPTKAAFLERPGVEIRRGDVTDRASIRGIAEGVDAVFHLAAYGNVTAVSGEESGKMHRVNVLGTANVLAECVGRSISGFVHFSSTAALGSTGRGCVDEGTPCRPLTPYQRSKFESEKIVNDFRLRDRVPAVIVRPCMIYGPGSVEGAFLRFCRMFKRGIFPRLPGRVLVSMVHVSDVVAGAIAALERGSPGQAYLIAGNRPVSIHDFRRWVVETLDVNPPYIWMPGAALIVAAWAVEVLARILHRNPAVTVANVRMTLSSRRFSAEKARREIGFVCSVDPESGVRQTVRYFVEQGLL